MSMSPAEQPAEPGLLGKWWVKGVLLVALILVFVIVYVQFGDALTLDSLAQRESQLRSFQQQHPAVVFGLAFAIYVLVTGLSLPGATVLTLVFGWYFGFWPALLVVSFASTAGATTAFLLSRFLFRDIIQRRFGDRLQRFNAALEREGPFFLFTLRLIPAVPFFVINAVMGLTPMRAVTFWWISQLGMLPGTMVYVYAGSRVPGLQPLADEGVRAVISGSQLIQLLVAFGLLGLFPLAVRWLFKWLGRKHIVPTTDARN